MKKINTAEAMNVNGGAYYCHVCARKGITKKIYTKAGVYAHFAANIRTHGA